ncbi:MAG: hypothetical protein PHE55_00895 [Methylococcaceae bacterium]|nr:hypothetical protein [Methylococcaceae bacterium]
MSENENSNVSANKSIVEARDELYRVKTLLRYAIETLGFGQPETLSPCAMDGLLLTLSDATERLDACEALLAPTE